MQLDDYDIRVIENRHKTLHLIILLMFIALIAFIAYTFLRVLA